jgi:hypothetical protein
MTIEQKTIADPLALRGEMRKAFSLITGKWKLEILWLLNQRVHRFGELKFKDRKSAEPTLEWVKSRVLKGQTGKFPVFESSIDELPGGHFQIDAFKTGRNGQSTRVF